MTPEEITEARKLADRRYCSDSTACDAVTAALSRALDALESAEARTQPTDLERQLLRDNLRAAQEKLTKAVEHSTEMESRQWAAYARAEAAEKRAGELREALKDANEMCRSAYSIAERTGQDTNWVAFIPRLHESLRRQHTVMFPRAALSTPSKEGTE